jgi:hypothetical protein
MGGVEGTVGYAIEVKFMRRRIGCAAVAGSPDGGL